MTRKPVLVCAPILLADQVGLQQVKDTFQKQGFDVIDLPLSPEEVDLAALLGRLDQAGVPPQDPRRVVLLTNCKCFALACYRFWNHLADEFVLFVDAKSPAFAADANEPLITGLASLAGRERDPIFGHLYLTLNENNGTLFAKDFLRKNFCDSVAPLSEFPFGHSRKGKHRPFTAREYALVGLKVEVPDFAQRKGGGRQKTSPTVSLESSGTHEAPDYAALTSNRPTLSALIIASLVADQSLPWARRSDALRDLLAPCRNDQGLAATMAQATNPVLLNGGIDPKLRVLLGYFLAQSTRHPSVLETVGTMVKRDFLGTEHHFAGFFLFYMVHQWFKVPRYPAFFHDQQEVLRGLIDQHRPLILPKLKHEPRRTPKSLLLLLGETDNGLRYGPSDVAVRMAKAFSLKFPDWRIAIGVTDRHRWDDGEVSIPEPRPKSEQFMGDFREALEGFDVELIFPSAVLPRIPRSIDVIDRVRAWAPQVICSLAASEDVVRGLLTEDYPVVERFVGYPLTRPDDSDLILSFEEPEHYEEELSFLGVPSSFRERIVAYQGVAPPSISPKRKHERESYGLSEDAFVLVMVGYELVSLMRPEIVTLLTDLLREFSQLELLLIGPKEMPHLTSAAGPGLAERVHCTGHSDDLAGAYQVGNAVFAPRQTGGVLAHRIAVEQGLPLIAEANPTDHYLVYVAGEENVHEDLAAVRTALERLMNDPGWAKQVLQTCRDAVARDLVRREDAMEKFMAHLETAETRFLARSDQVD